MKRLFVFLFALALGVMAWADAPKGYALYGNVPTGYEDLTSKVEVAMPAVITSEVLKASTEFAAPAAEGIAFTGRGHSSHYCQNSADLSIRFSEDQTLTLTENYAIHIKIKRTNAGSGDIQMSHIRETWKTHRAGFLISDAKLSDTESEIVLKYADRTQNAGGQWYNSGETTLYGTQTYQGGNQGDNSYELFRMTAANGEQFMITQIYIEADDTQFPVFEAPTPVNGEGYVLYGCKDWPTYYSDITSNVAYAAHENLSLDDSRFLAIKGTGSLPGRICEGSNYLQMSFTEGQSLSLDQDLFTLHIVVAKKRGTTGDLQVAFCKNGWSNARLGYTIANSKIGTEPTDIALTFADRVTTGSYNCYNEGAFWGSKTHEAAEFLRICAAANQEFMITGIYIEKPAVTRYYFFRDGSLPDYKDGESAMDLRPGTGTTLDGGNNTVISDDKRTFTRENTGWWSFNQKFSKAVDMQKVNYENWYMVIKFKTTCKSSDLNFRLLNAVAWTKPNDFNDIDTDGNWNILKLPLSDADNKSEFNPTNTGNGKTIFQVHSENSTAGQYFTIDYMYLTDDPDLSESPACDNCFRVTF